MDFANKLRKRRLELSLTQAELGQQSGVSAQQISAFENGVRMPSPQTLDKIVPILGSLGENLLPLPTLSDTERDWFRRKYQYVPRFERPTIERMQAAQAAYPALRADLEETYRRHSVLLDRVPCDSGPEYMFWHIALSWGSQPRQVAPQILGFRKFPVVTRKRVVIGDLRRPALIVPMNRLRCLFIPQVSVITPWLYTLDILVAVRSVTIVWMNGELDGRGHVSRWDKRREGRLGLPTLRIPLERVTDPRLKDWIEDELLARIPKGR